MLGSTHNARRLPLNYYRFLLRHLAKMPGQFLLTPVAACLAIHETQLDHPSFPKSLAAVGGCNKLPVACRPPYWGNLKIFDILRSEGGEQSRRNGFRHEIEHQSRPRRYKPWARCYIRDQMPANLNLRQNGRVFPSSTGSPLRCFYAIPAAAINAGAGCPLFSCYPLIYGKHDAPGR